MISSSSIAEFSPIESERLRMFIAGVSDYAIYMLSPEGIISTWNAGAQRFKGYAPQEIIGQHFSRFYTEEDRASGLPARALQIALDRGKFEDEGWRVRKDGSRFWASVVIDPIRNQDGTLIGFAKITRDITERRNAAEALERAKEALFQAQKLEALGKLTSGVAHDFNNLLNVIVSGLDLMARDVRNDNSRKIIASMQRAASRGATLTQQLLSFARQQPLKQERHNINSVIGSFEAVLRRAIHGATIFDIRLDPELPRVMIDAPQFEAALLNLVVNARDAMPDNGTLTLSTQQVTLDEAQVNRLAAGRYVKVVVQDNGCGMPADVVAHAVEPFFTTKEVGKGTGMGLSQAYGLMQQSGGDLTIESAVGAGTSISLYLPALPDDGKDDHDGDPKDSAEKALVVDDQPEVLNVSVELFRKLGYDVLSANNGSDALEILRRTPNIDVLFSDVVMPEMNGIELAKRARTLFPGLKIVLASGYAKAVLKAENADLKDFTVIAKPYRLSEIIRKLRLAG